ncbi:SDR family oxidoreductase [uncultured Hymenobacter sp.]|uniref:SDR family oxidoreductase n=1 Tax=uncultured Hymenobacter sp. TaxID=170016 RepID=UPI0035CAA6F1
MSTSLLGKVALITGSSSGLGKAIAERYAALGADVIIHYSKSKAGADEVVRAITGMGRRAVAMQADVTQVADVERLFAEGLAAMGKLDIVVANAGVELLEVPVADFTEAQFDQLFGTNTKGTYFTLQQAARHVADHGRIIYVASSTTSFPTPGMAVYGGSKMGGRYVVEVLAKEIGPRGVTVNSIIPYAIDGSGVFADPAAFPEARKVLIENCPMGRLGTVDDVANLAEFFASDLASFVNGQHLLVNGGAIG